MQTLFTVLFASVLTFTSAQAVEAKKTVYDFSPTAIEGKAESLKKYEGKVLLIVNTASQCGFTPQYEALQKLYDQYRESGLVVLGFPSNDFGHQEPGTNADICEFTRKKFKVNFPLYSKEKVLGKDAQPLYQWLVAQDPLHEPVSWNFEKFLIGRDGKWIARYKSKVTPDSPTLTQAIEAALKQKSAK